MSHLIEISLDIEVQASLAFWVDKNDWDASDDSRKRQLIKASMDRVNDQLVDDVIRFDGGNISATVMGPDGLGATIDLEQIQVYDPEE